MTTKSQPVSWPLEDVTTRLGNVFAEELEQHSAELFEQLLVLAKQLLGRKSIVSCSKRIHRSMEKHLEHGGEVGMQIGIALSFSFSSKE